MKNSLLKRTLGLATGVTAVVLLAMFGMTEEIPLVTVSGTVKYGTIGSPISNGEVYLESVIDSNDLSKTVVFRTKTDSQGKFKFSNVPMGRTVINAYSPGHAGALEMPAMRNGDDIVIDVWWKGDELQLSSLQPVITPDEEPTIVINGLTRGNQVKVKIFEIDEKQVSQNRDTYDLARNIAYNRYEPQSLGPEPKVSWQSTLELRSRDIQGKFAETVTLPKLNEGLYIARVETDGLQRHAWINVSNIALVTKVAADSILSYVVDIKSGRPVSGVELTLMSENGQKTLGKTGNDGTLVAESIDHPNGNHAMMAKMGSNRAYAMFYWWQSESSGRTVTHIVTDRPVYRPGDIVHYKAFVRERAPEGYRLTKESNATVTVSDPDGTEIAQEQHTIDAVGGFSGSFKTSTEITGSYRIETKCAGSVDSDWINVAAYRKSEFNMAVTPTKSHFVTGETAEFQIKATYYTGEPVVGATLSGSVQISESYSWSPFEEEGYEEEYFETYEGYGGETIQEVAATTDENGAAVIKVPTAALFDTKDARYRSGFDHALTLMIGAQDASGRYFSGESQVDLVSSDYSLSVTFDGYVFSPGEKATVKLRATERSTNQPAKRRTLILEYGRSEWLDHRSRDRLLGTLSILLDDNGVAHVPFQLTQTGDYFVRAKISDDSARMTEKVASVWCYSYGDTFERAATKLQVILDKKEYEPGESAVAVIRTSDPGGAALVTVEAENVLWRKIVALDQETTLIDVPVTELCKPNASVRVAYVKDKKFSEAGRTMNVSLRAQHINVSVEPSVKETLPGGTLSFLVSTKDEAGRPVQTDVALSVVDEAIYAIQEDRNDPKNSFFPRRWSNVGTYYSFPEVYLDGEDKDGAEIDLRSDFRDTAHWTPSVVTGRDGTATIEVALPHDLTMWRATATAVSHNAAYGKATGSVVARKPLMVRVSPPAFMVQDDQQTIGATIVNASGRDEKVTVTFSTKGLTFSGDSQRTMLIAKGASERVEWSVRAHEIGTAAISVTAIAAGSKNNDGVERTFQVKPNGPTESKFFAGQTREKAEFSFDVDKATVHGQLAIAVEPSILGSLAGSLDSLVDYPYGCVEQTMSRYIPAVAVMSFMKSLGKTDPALESKIADVAAKSQAKLRQMQRYDGGFGWFGSDDASAEMTALVLEGIYFAQRAGLEGDPHLRDRALNWGRETFKTISRPSPYRNESLMRLAYALSLHGIEPKEWWPVIEFSTDLSVSNLAYLYLAIDAAKGGLPSDALKTKSRAYQEIMRRAEESVTGISWESDWWYEPTALALRCIVKKEPRSDRAVKTLKYLLSARRGDSWTSTRDTTQVVLAGIDYLRAHKESSEGFQVTVSINGVPHKTYKFARGDNSRHESVIVPLNGLQSGKNSVEITVNGLGTAYYTAVATQTYYRPAPPPTDSGHGLTIQREYFRMVPKRMVDGQILLLPSDLPVTEIKPGEIVHCRLKVTSDRSRQYLLIEDPTFSHCRTSEMPYDPWNWGYWWSSASYLDDKSALFVYSLSPGTNIIEYAFRAEATGVSTSLPATISMMYQPDVRATSGSNTLVVRP